ncbi:MAG: YgjV family protein [Firmicutes bacterium]|nr:YgjV family protein [Bacillota bacterium]
MHLIVANIVGIAAIILFVISFQAKSNKSLNYIQALGNTVYFIQFMLLRAYSGAYNMPVYIARNLLFSQADRWEWLKWKGWAVVFSIPAVFVLWISWDGPLSIFPFIALVASNIGYCMDNPRTIRIAEMFAIIPAWIIYDIAYGAYAAILNELIILASILVSIYRFGWKNLGSKDFADKK